LMQAVCVASAVVVDAAAPERVIHVAVSLFL